MKQGNWEIGVSLLNAFKAPFLTDSWESLIIAQEVVKQQKPAPSPWFARRALDPILYC